MGDAHSPSHAGEDDTWSLVDFVVPERDSELVADALWMRGVVAIEERSSHSGFITLRTSMGEDPTELMSDISSQFPETASSIVSIPRSVADTWRQFATPTVVNDDVVLVPAWLPAPDDRQALFIEPLDTFGLGNHPTTVLALRLALRHVAAHSQIFDLGSGSGVLAVGLAKFLQCHVLAYDIADSAQEALTMNARLNEVSSVEWHEGIKGTVSDCVVANILAPVLIAESEAITHAVRSGGFIILSGMRDEQVDGVVRHYTGFTIVDTDTLEGWTAVVLQQQN